MMTSTELEEKKKKLVQEILDLEKKDIKEINKKSQAEMATLIYEKVNEVFEDENK